MRLFIGIGLPDEFRNELRKHCAALEKPAPGKYVRSDMYHVTLAYIGNCDEDMRRAAEKAMTGCGHLCPPTTLETGDTGYFGRPDKAILHLGFSETGSLHEISECLRGLLTQAGLPFDPKPLVPHITLARNVNAQEALKRFAIESRIIPVTALTLFNSCRVDDTLRYLPIAAAPLKNKEA